MDSENRITLGVLNLIQAHPSPNQRAIAGNLGIALGLANTYVKRCVAKGYVKIAQAPANRYVYYLTPTGFAEKSRLTGEFLRQSFSLFRQAREQYRALFTLCRTSSWERVALGGMSDLAEIALLCARESRMEVVGIVDPGATVGKTVGVPVNATLQEFAPIDAVLLTEMGDAQGTYERIVRDFSRDRVLVPGLLGVTLVPAERGGQE